jgi:hypothetical protein
MPIILRITSKDERDLRLSLSVFLHTGEEGEGGSIAVWTANEMKLMFVEASISIESETSDSLLSNLELGTLKAGETTEKTIYLKSTAISTKVIDFSLQTVLADAMGTEPNRVEEFEATSVIPVISPFEVASRVSYSTPRLQAGGLVASATISTILRGNPVRGVDVESLSLADCVSEILVSISDK